MRELPKLSFEGRESWMKFALLPYKSWENQAKLEEWIRLAQSKLAPPPVEAEATLILPPVKPAASTNFVHEYDPSKDSRSRTQSIDRTKDGGNRRRKPDGQNKKSAGRGRK